MEVVSPAINTDLTVEDVTQINQDYIENEPSDYESINSVDNDIYRSEHNSDVESDSVQNTERQEGDGEESVPPKKVDDDEDKKNPQYIPKHGTFYEHDDRTMEDGEEEVIDKKDRPTKKSIWIEKKERWGHDRFNENDQAPKSKSELIGIYGYDIRNEDGPPRARRRRRYGRGPNKYTRTWDDEEAYKLQKPVKIVTKKAKDSEEFPPLEPNNQEEEAETKSVEEENRLSNVVSNGTFKPVEQERKLEPPQKCAENIGPVISPVKEIKPTDYRGFTKVRQYKNSQIEQRIVKKQEKLEVLDKLEEDLVNLSITKNQNRQNNIPPRLQNEHKGPKRYSSLRQRSLPETAAPTAFNQQTYYANDYTPPQPQQAILSQPPPQPVLQQLPPAIQQVPPVAATALLPTPTQFAPAFPPAPTAFIPTAVPPPPFIPPQAQIINFVPTQPPFPQPPFQGFQHQQFNAVTPPAELNYQCQGGTTYYSTQSQHLGHMPLQRRPKAAIPILPPPPQEPRGRGRSNNNIETPPPGSEDSQEYEDVQENVYEDDTNNID